MRRSRVESNQKDVTGRYSNHADQEKCIQRVLELQFSRTQKPKTQTPRRVQRRMSAGELDLLLQEYDAADHRNSPPSITEIPHL